MQLAIVVLINEKNSGGLLPEEKWRQDLCETSNVNVMWRRRYGNGDEIKLKLPYTIERILIWSASR
jgi:hypothetical protein